MASFIGSPRMSLFAGKLTSVERSRLTVESMGATFRIDGPHSLQDSESGAVTLGIRPHDLHWRPEAPARCSQVVTGIVDAVEHTGTEIFAEIVTAQDVRLMSRLHRSARLAVGERIEFVLDPRDLHLFSAQTGECILDRSAIQPSTPAPTAASVNELGLS